MPYDRIILAKNHEYSSDTSLTGLNNNQIIVGGSGSGKTMSITEPCLLYTKHRNLIVTATKRRIVDKYKPLLESRGYNVEVLDFARYDNSTVGYDPLKFANTDEDIMCLAKNFVLANPRKSQLNKSDPYWDEASTSLMCALIGYVKLKRGNDASFADVIDTYKSLQVSHKTFNIETSFDYKFKELELCFPGNSANAHWESFCHLPPKTAACIISALSVTISYLFNKDLLNIMRMEKQIDFKSFANNKSVLFILTSPVNVALSNLVSVFYSNAIKELFEFAEYQKNGHLPIPIHIICDDFATGAPIPDFAQYISIIREKGLSVSILCQSESQLESIYSYHEAITIINNCDTYIFTGGMDIKTAHSVGQRINRPVDEILALPLGEFVIFRRGKPPSMAQRYPILNDPEYQNFFEEELCSE